MAVLSARNPTLLDLATRADPTGKIMTIAEILNEENRILDDMTWVEGNLPTGHLTTIRTGLPSATWRKYYGGIQSDKSETAQVVHKTGMLRALAEIDADLADLNGNTAEFRMSESRAFLEAMSQEMADTLFFGNESSEPEAFTGLAAHYNSLSAESGDNVIVDAQGTADNSIWLIVWGPETIFGIVPKGSSAGLAMKDYGRVMIEDASEGSNTGRMEAYRTLFRWDAGLCVKDWRYAVRVQVDYGDIVTTFNAGAFASSANLPDLMVQAMRRIPNLSRGRPVFYMSRDMATKLMQQTAAMGNANFVSAANVRGDMNWAESFAGIPVKRCDVLAATETEIS